MSTTQEHATTTHPRLDASASPDYFALPKRGEGVRRLNSKPLLIVAFLILLAVLGISYTFFQRHAAQMAAQAQAEQSPPSQPAIPPIRPEGTDYLPPAGQPALPIELATQAPVSNQVSTPVASSEALQRRLRQLQQAEDRRLAQWEAALNTEPSVQSFDTRQPTPMPDSASVANRLSTGERIGRYAPAVSQTAMAMEGYEGGNAMAAENQQQRKQAFLSRPPESAIYLAHQRQAAIAATQEIKAGWVIPSIMISGINSDLPGQIIGQVREAVYDSTTGTQCLIPAGSRVIGSYDSGVTLGQERALVVWRRIIYPDGSSLFIDNMPGADKGGYAGFQDQVDNHYGRLLGTGLLLSVFSAGTQLSQPQASNGENYSSSQIIAGSLGQQMTQIGAQTTQRNMNIQPSLSIRPGYPFNIMVTKDIILPTWQPHPMAGTSTRGCHSG